MATISNRLTSTGNLLVNGTIDEFTGAPVIDANVVLWLDAGQTASYSGSGTTWTDLSTTGLNGTLTNSPSFSTLGYFGFANASSQIVTFSNSSAIHFTGVLPYSFDVWVKINTLPAINTWKRVINREGNVGIGREGYNFWVNGAANGTDIQFYTERFVTGSQTLVGVALPFATTGSDWNYWTVTYDSAALRLYRNGSLVAGPSADTRSISNNSTTLVIGNGGGTNAIGGNISAVKIYNRALTAAEVLQNYNALAPRYGLTANTAGNTISRTTANTILSSQFDEVTYNPSGTIINRFSQTETFSTWTPTNASITTNNTTSPTGSFTASKLTEDSTNAIHRLLTSLSFVNGTTYTMSTYAKAAERRNFVIFHEEGASANRAGVQANLQTGTVVNYTTGTGTVNSTFISNVGNGWYRFGFSFTASANATVSITYRLIDNAGNFTYTGDGTSGLYVWGAQFEQGSSATIYQPIAAANTLASSTTVRKIDQAANYYIQGQFDEFTGAPVVDNTILLWLDAAQTTSYSGTGNTWTDLSANVNNATLVVPSYTNNNFGGYLTFVNGTNYGTLATSKYNTTYTGKTVFVVARMNSAGWTPNVSLYRGIIGTPDAVSLRNFNFYVYHNSANGYEFHFSSPGAASLTGNVAGLTNDTWFAAAVTNSSTAVTYYFNGNVVYNAAATLSQYNATTTEYIGRADGTWYGDIAQVMVYSRALTADEIAQNFNALRRRYNI